MTSCLATAEIRKLIRPLASRLSADESHLSIREVVTEILTCAERFVPCEAGSVMMRHHEEPNALVFLASFGEGSEKLPGRVLPACTGIASQVYMTGIPIVTNQPSDDNLFYPGIDDLTEHTTRSLLCVPLKAFGEPVGVLSLLDRKGEGGFCREDLDLMGVFSRYLTQSIQLLFEAKRQKEAALKDHLTGLFNDRYLYQHLSKVISRSLTDESDVGLIFLDLDHFKAVVDTHGHLIGSQALREFGLIIGGVVNRFHGMAARYGGDEYVAVFTNTKQEQMAEIAEELRKKIAEARIQCEGEEGADSVPLDRLITASVGVARLRQLETENKSVEIIRKNLIRFADQAMYGAKAKGKNCVHWYTKP